MGLNRRKGVRCVDAPLLGGGDSPGHLLPPPPRALLSLTPPYIADASSEPQPGGGIKGCGSPADRRDAGQWHRPSGVCRLFEREFGNAKVRRPRPTPPSRLLPVAPLPPKLPSSGVSWQIVLLSSCRNKPLPRASNPVACWRETPKLYTVDVAGGVSPLIVVFLTGVGFPPRPG